MNKFTRYQLPLLFWAVLIYILSSLKSLPHIESPILAGDKLAHMSVFFVFCLFSYRAFYFQTSSQVLKRWALAGAFLFSCLYGYLDELHQMYVPGRTYDYFDMLADATGALLYVIISISMKRRRGKQVGTG